MTSALRTSIAALALVAPLAALVATPAQAQNRRAIVAGTVAPDYGHRAFGWNQPAGPDRTPPEVYDVTPQDGARVGGVTRITARVEDPGSGIGNVTLLIDSRELPVTAQFDGRNVFYEEPFAPGRHTAELIVRDTIGNTTSRKWSFDVAGGGYGYDRGSNRRSRW